MRANDNNSQIDSFGLLGTIKLEPSCTTNTFSYEASE